MRSSKSKLRSSSVPGEKHPAFPAHWKKWEDKTQAEKYPFPSVEKMSAAGSRRALTTWVVEEAGTPGVNGIYYRTGNLCDGRDAFRKRGSTFALIRRGRDGWSIVDLGTSQIEKWSLTTFELYHAVNMQGGESPMVYGWSTVDGLDPPPFLRNATDAETQDDLLVTRASSHRHIKVDPLKRSYSDAAFMVATMGAASVGIPKNNVLAGKNFLTQSVVALRLPELPTQPRRRPAPGEAVDGIKCFRVTLYRPTALTTWGMAWRSDSFESSRARVIGSVDSGSPLDRWNLWQHIRGRPELTVQPGDRLLKADGVWVSHENEPGTQDGNYGSQAAESSKASDETGGCISLDFGRPAVRPYQPYPPQLRVDEEEAELVLVWGSPESEPPSGILGWAICMQDLHVGLWHYICGRTLVAEAVLPGAVCNVVPPDTWAANLWKGLSPGRPYAACIAMLTVGGWSAFSENSKTVVFTISANTGKWWTCLQPTREDGDAEWPDRPQYCIPSQLIPGCTAPVMLADGPRRFSDARRWLRLQSTFKGAYDGLHLKARKNGRSVIVAGTDRGSDVQKWFDRQAGTVGVTGGGGFMMHSMSVPRGVRTGDSICRVNGVVGAENIIKEFQRGPEEFVLRFERLAGGPTIGPFSVAEVPLALDDKLDHEAVRLAEQVQYMVLMEPEEGALVYGMLESDVSTLEELIRTAAWAAQFVSKPRHIELIKEAQKRLISLRRKEESMEALAEARAILDLKLRLSDITCDPMGLESALGRLEQVPKAVRVSNAVIQLVARVRSMQALWNWRKSASQKRVMLQAALAECLSNEFSAPGSPKGKSTRSGSKESSKHSEADEDERGYEVEIEEGDKIWIDLNSQQLLDAIESAEPYACYMEFDLAEANSVIARHRWLQEQAREKKRKAVFELQQMSASRLDDADSDDELQDLDIF